MKKIFLDFLASQRIYITRTTDKSHIKSLIRGLHPMQAEKNLIRLGSNCDGGYLVPDDLHGISALFSPGVGLLSNFELDCATRGIEVFMADGSVEKPVLEHERFHFTRKFIGPMTTSDCITMEDWINSCPLPKDKDLMLQMDIEGDEYLTIVSMSEQLIKRFRIIIVEFHDMQLLWNKEFFKTARVAFEKILQNHICVHIHPNNCCKTTKISGIELPSAMEFTFVRKERNLSMKPRKDFPHHLDADNTSKTSLTLPNIWYKSEV